MSDQEYMARVRAMERKLYRIAHAILWSDADCADAIQEAVFRGWMKKGALREERYFETWLTRILINECHNIQSARKRSVSLECIPEQGVQAADADQPLRDALAALSLDLRLPVLLFYMEGYKTREVAQILRIPEGTVKTRLMRAKRKLKIMLEEEKRA